eukprot:3550657-Rhodomonas_salina.4
MAAIGGALRSQRTTWEALPASAWSCKAADHQPRCPASLGPACLRLGAATRATTALTLRQSRQQHMLARNCCSVVVCQAWADSGTCLV